VIVATLVGLIVLPLIALRGKTLLRCYTAGLTLALFAAIVWRRFPAPDGDTAYLAFVAFAILELALFALFLAGGENIRWSANRGASIAAIVYALTIPSMVRFPIDGDEPFYLLLTESMAHDGDLDLANQYGALDQSATARPDLVPQLGDPTGPHGEQYSRHEPFLSLLLVPGLLLFGLGGAVAIIAVFGVLLVRSTIRWMEDEGIDDGAIRAVFPFFAFGPPVLFYATRIWPEVPAAFFFVEALRGLRARRPMRWVVAILGLVLLKLRFVLVAAGLIGAMLFEPRTALRRRRVMIAIVGAAIIVVPLLVMWRVTGSATSVHSWGELLPAPAERYVTGFFGLLADGMSSIPFQAPFYLLGLFAIVRWREMPRGFRMGVIAALLYILYLLPRPEWYGGWAPPLRYLVFVMPVLALGAAAVWDRVSRGVIALASLGTIALVIHGVAFPWRLFHIGNGENAAGEWLSSTLRADVSRLFPSFIRMNDAAWIGVIVVVLLVVVGLQRRRADLAIPIAALFVAAGFRIAQRPASRVEFEDTHLVRTGGKLHPEVYTIARFNYRGGWVMQAGDSVSFLARAGTHRLEAVTGLGATIELAGHAYHLEPSAEYQTLLVTIPQDGRVTLRCLSGAVNLDRMGRDER
jgi:hypothetical protein